MTDTPIYPHDPAEEIQPDVFIVRGFASIIGDA